MPKLFRQFVEWPESWNWLSCVFTQSSWPTLKLIHKLLQRTKVWNLLACSAALPANSPVELVFQLFQWAHGLQVIFVAHSSLIPKLLLQFFQASEGLRKYFLGDYR